MKILFYHPHPIPVKTYGGTERILYWLMKELAKLGHSPYLIGNPLSRVEDIGVKLISWDGRGNWYDLIPSEVDIAHLFYVPGDELGGLPVVTTIHGNGQPGERFSRNSIFLSKKHAEIHGADCFVYNGLDLEEYPYDFPSRKIGWDNFLFLANAGWKVKNVKNCVSASRSSAKNLSIAGGRWWGLSRYIHSYGMVDQKKKIELMSRADALVNPVRWHEPFGVNMIEAFSQGIPVIGSSYGSLKEVIREDVGICCSNYEEFLQAVERAPRQFDCGEIRSYVEETFSSVIMAKNYLRLYQKVVNGESLNRSVPQTISPIAPQELLPF